VGGDGEIADPLVPCVPGLPGGGLPGGLAARHVDDEPTCIYPTRKAYA
jgi:hypothetical protein